MRYILLILTATIIQGCAGHPTMVSFTPASVVVDYTTSDLRQATGLAQQFCQSIHKDAQYVRSEDSGYWTKERHGFFNCVDSSSSNSNRNNYNGGSNAPIVINNKLD